MNLHLVGFVWRKFQFTWNFWCQRTKRDKFWTHYTSFLNTVCSLHHVTATTCLEQTIKKCQELKLSCTADLFKVLHCFQLHSTSQKILPVLCCLIYLKYNLSKVFTWHSKDCLSFKHGASSYFHCKPVPYKHCAGVYHTWTTCGILQFISFDRLHFPTCVCFNTTKTQLILSVAAIIICQLSRIVERTQCFTDCICFHPQVERCEGTY